MRQISTELQAHLDGNATTLTRCWYVQRRDGVIIRSAEHDRPITITTSTPLAGLEGTYQATTGITGSTVRSGDDLSVDNLEMQGQTTAVIPHLSVADIEAGLFDDAIVIAFELNWAAPDDGQIILRKGTLGNIRRDTDALYSAELRGMAQRLSQITVRTYGVNCDAELGDARCGVDLALYRVSGSVATVTSRRLITISASYGSPPLIGEGGFGGGLLTFTSGNNDGFTRRVKSDSVDGLQFFEVFPRTIEVGDTFEMTPGCNKIHAVDPDTGTVSGDCQTVYGNAVNHRGHGWLMPGIDAISRSIDAQSGGGGGKK